MREYKDSSGRLTFEVSKSDSWFLFRKYAKRLEKQYNAKIIEKLDGFDQKYWNFEIKSTVVVLHSDSMVGISIHIEDGSNEELLREIVESIQK